MSAYTPITIQDLKKNLGDSLGARKNKYLIEIPFPDTSGFGRIVNILCMSTALPERNNSSTSIYMTGRKYNLRGETEYPGTYDISMTDTSDMKLRKDFDAWLNSVDNTNILSSEYVSGEGQPLIKTLSDFSINNIENNYQTDIKIWQLDTNGYPQYGYLLQNAFPTSLGAVELADDAADSLLDFSVTITYSEMIPLVWTGERTTVAQMNQTGQIANPSSLLNSFATGSLPNSKNLLQNIENNFKVSLPDYAYPAKIGEELKDFAINTKNSFLKLFSNHSSNITTFKISNISESF